jgi:hypothetical protein
LDVLVRLIQALKQVVGLPEARENALHPADPALGKPTSIKMLPVDLPTTRRQIGIITLKNRTLSPLAQLFIQGARDVARLLAKANSCH